MWHRSNLAAKESGPECPHANNDHFTVLASGGSGRCWVSMCTVWPSHSKWLSKSASDFALSLNIPPRKLFEWFRRPQLWAKMIGSFITTMCPLIHHILSGFFLWSINSPRWLSPTTAQIWHSATSGFSQNYNHLWKEEISDQWWDSGKYDGAADGNWENCVRSQGAYLERGLKHRCPKYNVFCILYLLQ